MLGFYVQPTAKVIRRQDLCLKSHQKGWRSPGSNSQPLVYKASCLTTTPWRLLRGPTVRTGQGKEVGLLGESSILKPTGNKDVPSNAQIVNINVITGGNEDYSFFSPAQDTHQSYGDVFEYSFPEYFPDPVYNQALIPPSKELPTNEIFDVDFEGVVKTPKIGKILMYPTVMPNSGTWTEGKKGTLQYIYNSDDTSSSTTGVAVLPYNDHLHTDYAIARDGFPKPFMVYCVSKGRQKVLGDFIQEHLYVQSTSARMKPIDHWMFDEFCQNVRPIWAKIYYPAHSTVGVSQMQSVYLSDATQASVPAPGEDLKQNGFEWRSREFHRFQDYGGQLTAADSYATRLLFGSLGPYSMECFHFARFRIYYQPTKVKADTLYFQSQQEFVFEQFRGSRKEYGTPPWENESRGALVDAEFKGVVTCQKGTVDYFEDGKINKRDDKTNVLQDEAHNNSWY